MRKVVAIFVAVLLLVAMGLTAFAQTTAKDCLNNIYKKHQEECTAVENTVKSSYTDYKKYLGDKLEDIDFDKMYQVYYLNDGNIVKAFDKEKNFGTNISENYYWVVPSAYKGGEVEVVRKENTEYGFAVRGGTTFYKNMTYNHKEVKIGIIEMFNTMFSYCEKVDESSIRFVYSEMIGSYLLYFRNTENDEFVIPYFTSTQITWMKNATLYNTDDFVDLVRENVANEKGTNKLSGGTQGDADSFFVYYIMFGTAIVVVVVVTAIIIIRKKDKTENNENNDKIDTK